MSINAANFFGMYNILQTTDKDNPITINGIIKKLDNEHKYGKVTRQTIYSYRDILLSCDDEVKLNLGTNGRQRMYVEHFYEKGLLSMFRGMLDRTNFLGSQTRNNITNKIMYGRSKAVRNIMTNSAWIRPKINKYADGRELDYLNTLEKATRIGKKVSFKYQYLDAYFKKQDKNNGALYVVSPLKLYYSNGNIYMFAVKDGENIRKTFRIDRMRDVCMLNEKRRNPGEFFDRDVDWEASIQEQAETMTDNFSGEMVYLTLEVNYSPKAMDIISDLSGTTAETCGRTKDGKYKVNFWAQKSPTLTSRLIQNMEFFKVVAPEEILEEIMNCAKNIMENYK